MRTDELERLLTEALHDGDLLPVDRTAAERRLAVRATERVPVARRWSVALVAASVLAVLLSTTLGLEHLGGDRQRDVTPAPAGTLSPSGLPVGLLTAPVDAQGSVGTGHLRLLVHADGTAEYSVYPGDSRDPGDSGFDVTLAPDGPNRFAMLSDAAGCGSEPAMTAVFTASGAHVTLGEVRAAGTCLVSREVAAALTGLTVLVRPLPGAADQPISPSGLPVGVLHASIDDESTSGPGPADLRLLVRSDGTGQYQLNDVDTTAGDDHVGAFDVQLRAVGDGRAELRYQGATCATFGFAAPSGAVTFEDVTAGGCLLSQQTAAALSGVTTRFEPLPESGSLG